MNVYKNCLNNFKLYLKAQRWKSCGMISYVAIRGGNTHTHLKAQKNVK